LENRKKSPREHYIIDGYNVMHFIPKFKNLLKKDLEYSRVMFIQTLSNYFIHKKIDVTVVFDGERNSSEINTLNTPEVKVIFSAAPEKADNKIKSLIDFSRNKALTIIISSDHEVYQYAKVSKCKAMTSDKFYELLLSKPIDIENKIKTHSLSKNELELWKEIFNKKK
jgi:predicted RNA-binding protein with PIN domain